MKQHSALIRDTRVSKRCKTHKEGNTNQWDCQLTFLFACYWLLKCAHIHTLYRHVPSLSLLLSLSLRAVCLHPLSIKIRASLCVQHVIRYLRPIFGAKEMLTSSHKTFSIWHITVQSSFKQTDAWQIKGKWGKGEAVKLWEEFCWIYLTPLSLSDGNDHS